MKKWKLALLVSMIFSGGVLLGRYSSTEVVSREIHVGYQNSERPGEIKIEKIIKNSEDQGAVDNIMMIFMNKESVQKDDERVTDPAINMEKPDVFLKIVSPKQYTGLIDARVWFQGENAVIANRDGVSWEKADFHMIGREDAEYLKETIEYKDE